MAQKDSIEQNYKLRELGDFKGAIGGSKQSYCGCVKDAAMPDNYKLLCAGLHPNLGFLPYLQL